MSSSVKYVLLLAGCGAAGLLAGSLLHTPPAAAPAPFQVAATPAPASTDHKPATDEAVAEVFAVLEKSAQPGTESADTEAVLLDNIERLSFAELAMLAAKLGEQTDNRLKNLTSLVVGYWAAKDLVGAREWAQKKRTDSDSFTYIAAVSAIWAKTDPNGFGDWLAGLTPQEMGAPGNRFLHFYLGSVGATQPERAVAIISKLNDVTERESAFASLFTAWAKRDPAAAAARVMQLDTGASKAKSVESVVTAWAEKEPDAAWKWVSGLPDAVVALKAQRAYIDGLAKRDPGAAAERVAELPLTEETNNLLRKLASEWARKDPEAAAKWAPGIDDDEMRRGVQENVQSGALSGEFEAATQFILRHAAEMEPSRMAMVMLMQRASRRYGANLREYVLRFPENYRVEAVLGAAQVMKATQPNFVEEWALKEPEGETRDRLLESVVSSRQERDPEGSITWAKGLPDGESKRRAINVLLSEFYDDSPKRALEIIPILVQPDERAARANQYAQRWLFESPKAARSWIESTELLKPEDKRELLKN